MGKETKEREGLLKTGKQKPDRSPCYVFFIVERYGFEEFINYI